MPKLNLQTTISVDTRRSVIHFFSMLGNDESTIDHRVKSYTGMILDDAFFARFKEVVTEYVSETPSEAVRKVTLVIPDDAVALDIVNVPTLRNKFVTKNALNLTLGGYYRNYNDLRIHSHVCAQNKQYTTFQTAAVQKLLLSELYSACSENKLLVDTTTFAACSAAAAVVSLNPKLKNESYLLLDIKDTYSRFVFVVDGRPAGFFPLPFGLEFLSRPKYVQEDMLFDHRMAEITVLNARERAKAKKLTVLAEQAEQMAQLEDSEEESTEAAAPETKPVPVPDEEDNEIDLDIEEAEAEEAAKADEAMSEMFALTAGQPVINQKVMAKKTPRKLPKFMQRQIPEDEEGIACENFRVFMKWALSLMVTNDKITSLGRPEFILVNLPEKLAFLLDYANTESEENGLEFRPISEGELDPLVRANLELYGGLFTKSVHAAGKL